MSAKIFVFLFVGITFAIFGLSFLLHELDLPYTDNDIIRQYQFDKLNQNEIFHTIIVGDSSAGNAIDAEYFQELSGYRTVNLALTGNFGHEGSYNMIRQTLKKHPLKNIIIMHSLYAWKGDFSYQGYIDTASGLSIPNMKPLFLKYHLLLRTIKLKSDPKEIVWFVKYIFKKAYLPMENDYIKQKEEKFSSNSKSSETITDISPDIHETRRVAIKLIDSLCEENRIRCIYAHGPIHNSAVENSRTSIEQINKVLNDSISLIPVRRIFSYPSSKIGDSEDHIDPKFKKQVTKEYYETIAHLLIP